MCYNLHSTLLTLPLSRSQKFYSPLHLSCDQSREHYRSLKSKARKCFLAPRDALRGGMVALVRGRSLKAGASSPFPWLPCALFAQVIQRQSCLRGDQLAERFHRLGMFSQWHAGVHVQAEC